MSAGPTRVNLCWINRNKRHACRGFVVVFPAFPSSYPKLAQPALNLGSINHPTKEFVAGVTFELPEVMDILLEQKQSGTLTCLLSRRFFGQRELTIRKTQKGGQFIIWVFGSNFFEELPMKCYTCFWLPNVDYGVRNYCMKFGDWVTG